MNLDTCQILTAAKSLIEEHAEERHLANLEKYKDQLSSAPWPQPFDYFYGKLILSPDNANFLSQGWNWGSMDSYNIYNVGDFITNDRIAYQETGFWEHETRGACWMDNETIAILYDPYAEGDDGTTIESSKEIHVYKLAGGKTELKHKIAVDKALDIKSNLFFSTFHSTFIVFYKESGLMFLTLEGKLILTQNLQIESFDPKEELFLVRHPQSIVIYGIET